MGTINNFQEEIYETIDILVGERVKQLDFDKTEKGEVVSVGEHNLEVRISGEIFNCKIKSGDTFEVGDVIYVKIPKNKNHDMYAESGSVKRYIHVKYSEDGGETFTGNNGDDEGSWMGLYVGSKSEAPNNPSEYKWNRIKGVDGKTQRVWIRYSEKMNGGAEDGSDMTRDPNGMDYIGIATTLVNVAPENPNSYSWSKIQGDQGVPGENGYVHIKYSNDGGLSFTVNEDGIPDGETVGDWIGVYTDHIEKDSGDPADYTWNKVVGESERVWIRYSKYADGGASDGTEMGTNPRDMGYVGFAYNFNETAPSTPSGYDWVKITGEDGVPGHNGYIHIKYSNDGGETFTLNDEGYADGETVGDWIGIYTDAIKDDSMVVTDYTWNRIVGESTRLWIRYSNEENGGVETGQDMSIDPKGKTYIGISTTQGDVAPSNPNSYSWSKIQGTDGVKGDNGYIHIKYSNDGGVTFTQPGDGERVGDWIGIYTDEKEEDSTDPTRYKWNKVVGESERIWIQYSDKADGGALDGSEMTANPVGRKYIGIAHTMDKEQPTDPSLYSWSKILGEDGVKGDTGYIHIKYSNNAGETFTENTEGVQDGETPGKWIGIYTDNIEGDSPYPTDYTWNKVVGDDGLTHGVYIRYSMYADGGADEEGFDMSTNPDGMDYIGIGTSTNGVPPRNPRSYTWSKIRGEDGVPGENGYVHIKYSNDGTTFTPNNGEDFGSWIGIYTDNIKEDSLVFSDYDWNKIVGEPGKGIESIVEFYLISANDSGVTVDSSGWSETIKKVTKLQPFLWNYEQVTYTDGDTHTTTPVIIGTYSENGVGVSSITNYYLASPLSEGVTRSTPGWTTTMQPMDSKGNRFLWNYEVVAYTNGSSVPTDPVVIGSAGIDGYNGKDAIVGVLTNDNYVVPADEAGWVKDYTDINTEMQIFYGTFDDTANWTFRVPYQENMRGTLTGNKYQVNYISAASGGYAEIEAKRPGFPTVRKKFTVAAGRRGASSITYWLDLETTALKEDMNGNYDPPTIKATAMRQRGAQDPESFKAMFMVMDKAPEDFSATVRYRTAFGADETSIEFIPRRGLEYLTVGLYKDNYINRLDMETIPVVRDGVDGTVITNVEEFYLASDSRTGITTGSPGWQGTVPIIDENSRYLWNYERTTYSKGEPHTSTPVVIGTFSKDGASISAISEYYLVSEYRTGVTRSTAGWSTNVPDPDSQFKFLWNYSVTSYTDGTSTPTDPVVIGVYGKDGKDGKPGVDGADGVDGTSAYVWIKYSNKANGGLNTGEDMHDEPGDRAYIGIFSTDSYTTAPSNPALYEWSKYKGEDGAPGLPGQPGKPGDPGQPAHIHIKYSSLPQGGFSDETMFDDPEGREYVGIMNSNSAIPSTSPSDYRWSKIQGDQGVAGESSYTHIRYSDNGTTFTGNQGRNLGKWIGIYVSGSPTGSTTFSDYGWSRLEGVEGRGVESITQQYYLSTSSTSQVGGEWVDNQPPEWTENHYMWTRNKITYNQAPLEEFTTPVLSDIENRLRVAEFKVNQAEYEISSKVSLGDVQSSFAIGLGWAKLSADRIDIEGAVTFSSLNEDVKSRVAKGESAQSTVNGLLTPGKTTIDGGKITTNSIKTDSLITTTLSAIEAQLGNVVGGSITGGEFISSSATPKSGQDPMFGNYTITSNMLLKEDTLRLDGNRYYSSYGRYRTGGAVLKGDGLEITQNSPLNTYGLMRTTLNERGLKLESIDADTDFTFGEATIRIGSAAEPVIGSGGGVIIDSSGGLLVNGNLEVGGEPYTNNSSGNLKLNGNLYMDSVPSQGAIYCRDINVAGTVSSNNLNLTNDFYIRWDAEIGRYLKVGGTATFNGAVNFNNNSTFNKKTTFSSGGVTFNTATSFYLGTAFYGSVYTTKQLVVSGGMSIDYMNVRGHISDVGGSDDNWYIKFTNGVMISQFPVSFTASTSTITFPSAITDTFYYPASFVGTPYVSGKFEFSEEINVSNRQVYSNRCNFRVYHRNMTSNTNISGTAIAIGRWKTINTGY